ncbi:MAG: acyl-ACP--UDP-N-acetylglucosamine O-acyltransferase [Verrucomicrobiales bacterium]|nr:acyl-ACP--UDP-N-acetylglucosamine O-acyltransferase [Verrucomicrobiales bacterium]
MSDSIIHPSAIIDAEVEIGEGVRIGPGCVIRGKVKLGAGCELLNHVTIEGPTEIGVENIFHTGAVIGGRTQDLKYAGEPTYLKIGDHNNFREYVTVNRATIKGASTIIGSHGNFLAYSHIAHDCIVGDHVIFSNNGTLAGHVTMGDHAILGGLTAVHQFCRIGDHVITGGCSKIVQDIPPYMIADGNPAKVRAVNSEGLRRRGFDDESIRTVKKAFKKLYRKDLNKSDAIAALRELPDESGFIAKLIEFVNTSERGIH